MAESVKFKFKLGDRVKDRVTGYIGIADQSKVCLNGCIQYSVQGPTVADGKLETGWWIDEQQLERVDHGINDQPIEQTPTGGPMQRVER